MRISTHTLRMGMLAATIGALAALPTNALGDEIVMRDGTVYNGEIVSKSRRQVIMDTEVHGIKTRLTLDRRQIKSVVESDTPETDDDASDEGSGERSTLSIPTRAEKAEAETKSVQKRDGYNLILEVPIEGTFGQHVYPLGIKDALDWAVEHEVTDVVFRINSPGGEVWAAQDMVAVMDRYADKLTYHMLIEHAISASIWPSFTCDTITMVPGATFGGAVVFHRTGTGSAEVDLKMTSIMAAKLGSQAEANGHSEYLVKAMMLSEAAVYAYQDSSGEWVLANSTESIPANRTYHVIDGPESILTLTTKQASEFGLVTAIDDRTLESFAEANGIAKWDNAGEIGTEIIDRDLKKCQELREDLEAAVRSFQGDLAWYSDSKYVASAGSALQNMRKSLGKYKRLMDKAKDYEMPSIVDSFGEAIDVAYWEAEIESRMADLRRIRKRGP